MTGFRSVLSGVGLIAFSCSLALAQQIAGDAWNSNCHDNHYRQAASAARPEIRRGDQGKGVGVEPVVGAARRAAEGAPNVLLIMTDDVRLRRAGHVRRRRSRRRRSIASPRAGCATRTSTRPRCARRRARR